MVPPRIRYWGAVATWLTFRLGRWGPPEMNHCKLARYPGTEIMWNWRCGPRTRSPSGTHRTAVYRVIAVLGVATVVSVAGCQPDRQPFQPQGPRQAATGTTANSPPADTGPVSQAKTPDEPPQQQSAGLAGPGSNPEESAGQDQLKVVQNASPPTTSMETASEQPFGEQVIAAGGAEPSSTESSQRDEPSAIEQSAPDNSSEPLGPPLIDHVDQLTRLHPIYPVWVDRARGILVTVGRVCQRRTPLELFACQKGSKEHESVVVIDTKGYVIHAGLLALGAEPGSPVKFAPQFVPPSGTEIEIEVLWKEASGRLRRAQAQDWVRDVSRMYRIFDLVVPDSADDELDPRDQIAAWQQMEQPWVFAGSQLVKDEQEGRKYYAADVEGDLICLSNFPSAVLDVPFRSTDSNAALLFACYTERIPPIGTPVTLVLRPKLDADR